MPRQAFRKLAVWFFAHRDLQAVREFISKNLRPFWPTYQPAKLTHEIIVDRIEPSVSPDLLGTGRWQWRRTEAPLDINPGSGEALFESRLPLRETLEPSLDYSSGPVDLLTHARPRRVPREPALVLHCGADTSLAAFVGEVLPRFFALDEIGLAVDVLLLVGLPMGRQRYFQDALIDQIFYPRPIELLRKHRLIHVDSLHEVIAPATSPLLLARMADRVSQVYGPFNAEGPPVFLCAGGAARARAITEDYRHLAPQLFACDHVVIDPSRISLREVVKALATAPLVAAPNTGEAALLALAPNKTRGLLELAVASTPEVKATRLLEAIKQSRTVVSRQ